MIIVCGEALIDCIPARCGDEAGFVPRAGGSPYNVAVGLARLEAPVGYLGRLSTDPFGRLLRDRLIADGVALDYAVDVDAPSPLAIVHLDAAGVATYSFHLEGSATAGLSSTDVPDPMPDAIQAVHTGSLALLLEPGATAVTTLLRRAHSAGRLTTLDPNVRPSFVPDRARYLQQLDGWLADTDVVKASQEDVSWLHPGNDPVEVLRDWTRRGPTLGVLTRGDAGAVAVTPTLTVPVAGAAVDVVDTVGAGDAFTSGLIAWLHTAGALDAVAVAALDEPALAEALRFATAVAGRTCARAGADPPRRGDL